MARLTWLLIFNLRLPSPGVHSIVELPSFQVILLDTIHPDKKFDCLTGFFLGLLEKMKKLIFLAMEVRNLSSVSGHGCSRRM